jgi:transcription elongation factor GreA
VAIKKTIQLTAEGKARLEEELRELSTEELPELKSRIQVATEEGDISDNSEYEELKETYMQVENRIRELEQTLERAEVIPEGSVDGSIGLGSHVTVRSDDGETETWILVSPEEASAADGRYSTESPIGRALLGKRADATVTVQTPGGAIVYSVVDVK